MLMKPGSMRPGEVLKSDISEQYSLPRQHDLQQLVHTRQCYDLPVRTAAAPSGSHAQSMKTQHMAPCTCVSTANAAWCPGRHHSAQTHYMAPAY
jgi:hypothetical protein